MAGPQHTFETYRNPFAGSIADMIARRGEDLAQGTAAAGAYQGRGQELSGQIWGHGIAQTGADVAGAVATATDPRRKLEALQLQDAQARQAGQQRVDQLLTPYQPNGPQPEGEGPAPAQHPYLTAEGLYDIPKLTEALAASGMAHHAPDLLKGAQAINDSIVEHQQRQQKLAEADTVLYGDMADGALKLTKAGLPFDQALDLAAAPGLATNRFAGPQYGQIRAKLLSLPPEQQQAALGALMDAAAKVAPDETLAKDAQKLDRYGRVKASNMVADRPTEASLAAAAAAGDANAAKALALLKPPKEAAAKSLQSKSVLVDGKPTEVSYNPADGSWQMGGQPIDAARVKPMPPASTRDASDVTELSPAGLDAAALNYAKTGVLPPLGNGDKVTRKKIINRAAEMMPGLDVASAKADFSANQEALKGLTKQRESIGAFETTAKKNIQIFLDTAGKVVDSGSPLINRPLRAITGALLGSADQAAFDAARQVAVNEIAKITTNPTLSGQLSDSARHEVSAFNPANATLKQTVAIMRLLGKDMDNRTSALDEQISGIRARIKTGQSGGSSTNDPLGIR